MENQITPDVAIIGGGIAGLWTLAALSKAGIAAILLENTALGSGQTIKSQGIIHGGLKYSLQGILNPEAKALKLMPDLWQQCLAGNGEIDLTATRVLSPAQYLWSTNSLKSKVANFFASKALTTSNEYPAIFQSNNFSGKVYKLEEIVIDIHSLLNNLSLLNYNNLLKIDNFDIKYSQNNEINYLQTKVNQQNFTIKAKHYIFTAGENNPGNNLQLRPLHMVTIQSHELPKLYGHCIIDHRAPLVTITSHSNRDNIPVWYLGGKLAEDGINYNQEQQMKQAKNLISKLFPWLNLTNSRWYSFLVNRAEMQTKTGNKPVNCSLQTNGNATIAWPTKLALAPVLANKLLAIITSKIAKPYGIHLDLDNLPKPQVALPVWH